MNLFNKYNKDSPQQIDPEKHEVLDSYDKQLAENAKKRIFWEDYIKSLTDIDFNFYSEKLKVPVLVPMGKRIFFRGELIHTNEIFVSLYSNYFTRCSMEQANILRQHRMKDAHSKLDICEREKLYLENQRNFIGTVLKSPFREIVEVCSEEEYKAWRLKHRDNVRVFYQQKQKNVVKEEHKENISDEDLRKRLEELELQEDLKCELFDPESNVNIKIRIRKENHQENVKKEVNKNTFTKEENMKSSSPVVNDDTNENKTIQMKDILDKQNELKKKLTELQNSEGRPIKTESDLITKMDKLGQVEEIEDDIYRLDDVIHKDAPEENKTDEKSISKNIKRSVTFADEDESETLELNFKHSEMGPCYELYDPNKGILKPSDIYEAFSYLFTETTPILRKTKYEFSNMEYKKDLVESKKPNMDNHTSKVIFVKDVNEKPAVNKKVTSANSGRNRPMSLFKKRRQNKS